MDRLGEAFIHKVGDCQGTFNEMTGERIMALFGTPTTVKNSPRKAVSLYSPSTIRCVISTTKKNQAYRGGKGIHTGHVVVSILGNELLGKIKTIG